MKNQTVCALALLLLCPPADGALATFEDVPVTTGGIYIGADGAGTFLSDSVRFSNTYNSDFGSWSGFAVSRHTDTSTPGFTNQYSAITGGGAGGSASYGVAYVSTFDPIPTITLPAGQSPQSVLVTNTTYAYLAMLNGEFPARKFGGLDGTLPDFLKLTITGLDAGAIPVGTIEFFLADFRAAETASDYIIDDWTSLDLSSLAGARSLTFATETTDNHPTFGANTPTYFALDNLVTVPEPGFSMLAIIGAGMLLRRRR